MIGTARSFFICSIAFGLLGMLLGLAMAISQDHSAMPAHAHILVIGWLSFAVFGLFYHLFPAAAASLAARVHCVLALVSAPVLFVAVYLVHTGNTAVEPLAAISSVAYALSFLASRIIRLIEHPEAFRARDEFSNRPSLEFLHHPLAVGFDRSFSRSQIERNLLIQLSANDQFKDLLFAPCQSGDAFAQLYNTVMLLKPCLRMGQRRFDCCDQVLLRYRFG